MINTVSVYAHTYSRRICVVALVFCASFIDDISIVSHVYRSFRSFITKFAQRLRFIRHRDVFLFKNYRTFYEIPESRDLDRRLFTSNTCNVEISFVRHVFVAPIPTNTNRARGGFLYRLNKRETLTARWFNDEMRWFRSRPHKSRDLSGSRRQFRRVLSPEDYDAMWNLSRRGRWRGVRKKNTRREKKAGQI